MFLELNLALVIELFVDEVLPEVTGTPRQATEPSPSVTGTLMLVQFLAFLTTIL